MDVFTNLDGDYHVHILVDEQYENLIKMNFIMFTYGEILRWMSILPLFIIGAYFAVSFLKPQHILLAGLYQETAEILLKIEIKRQTGIDDNLSFLNASIFLFFL